MVIFLKISADVAVVPPLRRRGVAQRLLLSAQAAMAEWGIRDQGVAVGPVLTLDVQRRRELVSTEERP